MKKKTTKAIARPKLEVMPSVTSQKQVVSFHCHKEVIQIISELAREYDSTLSDILRYGIDTWLVEVMGYGDRVERSPLKKRQTAYTMTTDKNK